MPTLKYDPAFFGDTPSSDEGGATSGTTRPYDPAFFGEDVSPIPEPPKKLEDKPSAFGTAARVGGGAMAPGLAGLYAGGQAGVAATAASAPFIGPFAPLAGLATGLVVGGGVTYAARRAQDEALARMPKVREALGQSPEQQQQDYETNPTTAFIAGAAPSLITGRPTTAILRPFTEAGKTALRTGAFNAGVTAFGTAAQQAAQGEFEPTDILKEAAIGALGMKTTALGRRLGMQDLEGVPKANATEVDPNTVDNKPVSLLALPKPSDIPVKGQSFTVSESGLVSADPNIRRAAMEQAPVGTQGDLFALGGEDTTQAPRPGRDVTQPVEQGPPPDTGGPLPPPMDGAGQPSLFTKTPTAGVAPEFGPREVRMAVLGGGKPDAYGLKLAQKVSGFLKDQDPVAAADHIAKETDALEFANVSGKTVDARKAQIGRATELVKAYTSKMTNALAEEGVQQPKEAPVNNIAAVGKDGSVTAIREDNAARAAEEAKPKGPSADEIAHANQVAEDGRRHAILKHVLDDPDTISPAKRFAALLKRQNLDPAPRAYEKEEIIGHLVRKGRADDAKAAFEGLTESGNKPDTSGTAAMEALIPERKPKETPAPKPEAAKPVKAQEFKLESQSEGDLRAIEAARVRREGKAGRREAAAEAAKPAAAQGEMFTEKGNPTKAAMAKRPALPKDEPTKTKTKRPKLPKDVKDGKSAEGVRPQKSDDGRQEGQARLQANEKDGRQERLLSYDDVKKRADTAVAARTITPQQHGMVEAAIKAKSHSPAELGVELDKILARSSEKPFAAKVQKMDRSDAPRTSHMIDDGAKFHDVMTHLEEDSPTPENRVVAGALKRLLNENEVNVRRMTPEEEAEFKGAQGIYFEDGNIIISKKAEGQIDQIVLHEGVHAATVHAINAETPAGRRFIKLFNDYKELGGKWGARNVGDKRYGFTNPQEFAAEVYTNPDFRAVLKGIKDSHTGETLWSRFLNVVRRMFKMDKSDVLARIIENEANLFSGGADNTLVRAAREGRPYRNLDRMQEAARTSHAAIRRNVEKAPKEQRTVLTNLARIMSTAKTKGFAALAMGNNLYDMAHDRGIKGARTLERMDAERTGAANAMIQPHLKLIESARKLPGETLAQVNRLIQDSTSKWEYAFYPDYLRQAVKDPDALGGERYEVNRKLALQVKVNPELNKRFKALPKEAQRVIKDAFRLSHDRLYDEKAAVLNSVATSYDGLIADTKAALVKEADPARRQKLKTELHKYNEDKKQELSYYSGMLNMDASRPYAPLTRNGNWLVSAKSDKYLAAEAAGDTDAMRKMQSDPKHYFVDFAGSHNEGLTVADAIRDSYGDLDKNVFVQERNKFADKIYSGRDMAFAVGRLDSLARQSGADRKIRQIITDLKLKVLSQNSIRRAEMQRVGVAAGDLDMMSNVLSHGRSSAHFIGSIYHAEDTLKALQSVIKEVDYPGGKQERTGRADRAAVVNEITSRYLNGMTRPPDDDFLTLTANKLNAATSLYMLGVKPSYYVQQAVQSWMYSHPVMASRFGYGKATSALTRAYKTVADASEGVAGLFSTDQVDLSKLPEKYQGLANHMFQSGILEVGINTEMGGSNDTMGLSAAGEKVMDKVRAMSRKVEAINRLTAGIAQYDLDMANPKTMQKQHDAGAWDAYQRDFKHVQQTQGHTLKPFASEAEFTAADNAVRMVRQTHGDLSMANSPTMLRSPVGRVLGQFKKFPLIMAGMYGREINRAFLGKDVPPAERAIARKTLMYLFGHGAVVAGGMGMPGYNIAKIVYDWLASTDNEPADLEVDVRKAIGDEQMSDLILKGAPSLLGVNASSTLGQGNLLSLAPFADLPTDRTSYNKFLTSMAGPALGGLVPQVIDGLGYAARGDYYKGLEKVIPRGLSDGLRAYRERTQGETNKNNEVTADPDEMPTMDTIWRAMGFSPLSQSNRQTAADLKYQTEDFYKTKVSNLRREYVAAAKEKNGAELKDIREKWSDLQDARVKNGLKRQPLGDLLKSPREQEKRERNTLSGMQYTRRNKGLVTQLDDLFAVDADDDNDATLQDALSN